MIRFACLRPIQDDPLATTPFSVNPEAVARNLVLHRQRLVRLFRQDVQGFHLGSQKVQVSNGLGALKRGLYGIPSDERKGVGHAHNYGR